MGLRLVILPFFALHFLKLCSRRKLGSYWARAAGDMFSGLKEDEKNGSCYHRLPRGLSCQGCLGSFVQDFSGTRTLGQVGGRWLKSSACLACWAMCPVWVCLHPGKGCFSFWVVQSCHRVRGNAVDPVLLSHGAFSPAFSHHDFRLLLPWPLCFFITPDSSPQLPFCPPFCPNSQIHILYFLLILTLFYYIFLSINLSFIF